MNIPEHIIEAAANDWDAVRAYLDGQALPTILRAAFKAAGPLLAAQVLREEATLITPADYPPEVAPYVSMIKANLNASADELEAGK